ncbi:chromatin assembly factor 1 subunit B, putative [Aspergillus fumigatus Af293]|uniref:Chromatin assembly factor 1 subunit B, putative n=1 Tax=Aspergillus fumigatus (strain ATCC MYA-4609 / CBS 101355 / FGSC A1100 / Af293) TaxID=330879 RepID=Q4WHV8_ASPFU|nr:chromatin assembly factor 1 subunit B, putative [Aspergillus fumigatus Af293]EAL87497.1 chromatin assembly factor 1 subunit B, putative [Aspergillus fumigatus Af293]
MKATPLLIAWHNDNAPIYSVHFDPNGKGRLATAGKRRSKGEMLASAGDDGNVLLWVPSELQTQPGLGEDRSDDKETWRVKHMCRSSGAEIYDLAWSPDGVFIITGSMDNIARIYNAQTDCGAFALRSRSGLGSSERIRCYSVIGSICPYLQLEDKGWPIYVNVSREVPQNGSSSQTRRSSFGSSPSIRRSASPAPSLPLPAVKPLEVASPNVLGGLTIKNANIYANETFTSFFRRLTFTPDGSLLFTPAGQYKTTHVPATDPTKTTDEIINTVYIYTRAGFNKPPISHLPGHKKPSVAVKCSPILYTLRKAPQPARHITLDTSSGEESFASLPEPVVSTKPTPDKPSMEPPSTPSASESSKTNTVSKNAENEGASAGQNPSPVFSLPYRIVYAVATQDAVLVYDTQQQTPLCVVSNLHFATFTDLTWSDDGLTLIMSSSDGFCSTLSFAPGELGQPYTPPAGTAQHPASASTTSANQAPQPSPANNPSPLKLSQPSLSSSPAQPAEVPPASPARSNSVCSMTTQSPIQQVTAQQSGDFVVNNPTPTLGSVPLVTAANSAQPPILPFTTPPQTPMSAVAQSGANSVSNSVLGKRDISESEKEDSKDQGSVPEVQQPKKRRVAPTLISAGTNSNPPSSSSPNHEVS